MPATMGSFPVGSREAPRGPPCTAAADLGDQAGAHEDRMASSSCPSKSSPERSSLHPRGRHRRPSKAREGEGQSKTHSGETDKETEEGSATPLEDHWTPHQLRTSAPTGQERSWRKQLYLSLGHPDPLRNTSRNLPLRQPSPQQSAGHGCPRKRPQALKTTHCRPCTHRMVSMIS